MFGKNKEPQVQGTLGYHALKAHIPFNRKMSNIQKRQAAIELVEEIARDLSTCDLTHWHISTAHDPDDEDSWNLFAFYGNSNRGMSLETRCDVRASVLSTISASQPEVDGPVEALYWMSQSLHDRWLLINKVSHETQFHVLDGKAFLLMRDGRIDHGENKLLKSHIASCGGGSAGSVRRALSIGSRGGVSINSKKGRDLATNTAIHKLRYPSKMMLRNEHFVKREIMDAVEREMQECNNFEASLRRRLWTNATLDLFRYH